MSDIRQKTAPVLVVTGFGPFRQHVVNASWEVVKELKVPGTVLVKLEVPVVYEKVNEVTSGIWTTYNPKLVVHCGVSHLAEGLVLESVANTAGYSSCDVSGCLPPTVCGKEEDGENECQRLRTDLDLERVAHEMRQLFSKNEIKVPVSVSENAGRYLCEYIYYKSLSNNSNRCVFIHVPQLDKHSVVDSAQTLTCIIQSLLGQMQPEAI